MKRLTIKGWQQLWLDYAAYRQRIESEKTKVRPARVLTIYEWIRETKRS